MQERLQGTDGIRREVRVADHPSVSGLTPLTAFLKKDIITEEFCELYTYAYTGFLKKKGIFKDGAPIVIGWDPRDKDGIFTGAALRGIRKGGGRPLVLGIVPTPLVPLLVAEKNAVGGVMITASHNPPDQNGIKLFVSETGVKPLPFDDIEITSEILKTDYSLLKNLPLKYSEEDVREEALKIFQQFSLDPLNSWITGSCDFAKTNIVVDPANGSFSGLAATLFDQAGFLVTEVSANTDGEVNRDCGVVELEGVRFVHPQETEKGRKFGRSAVLREILDKGQKLGDQIKRGEARVAGAVFDADGDRFIRLDYDPFKDRVIVSSGDETAFLQALHMMKKEPEKYRNTVYINTVESDLNASIAAEKLGYKTLLTGVGDKWLLQESLFLSLESAPGFNGNIEDLRKKEDLSAIHISELVTSNPPVPGNIRFAIGAEESGHAVTAGFLRRDNNLKPLFIGNGFKSAINSFVSTETLGKTPSEYYEMLEKPFDPGYKKTLYVYYVKKEMLSARAPFRKKLRSYAEELIDTLFGAGSRVTVMERPEEPDMLYFSVIDKSTGLLRAGIYVRNSGTEDKTGVNLRGALSDRTTLEKAGESLRDYLLTRIKNPEKAEFKAERHILDIVRSGRLAVKELPVLINETSTARILREMLKQGLVKLENEVLELAGTGLHYHDHLREKKNESG